MTKEQILGACSMRLDGHTLQEIADKYGVSAQYISTIVPRSFKTGVRCIYPALKAWMGQKGYSAERIAKFCDVHRNTVYGWLNGKHTIDKPCIDKILQLTGMTYEEAFREERPCDKP